MTKIFQDQKGQLPADVADALLPAAFIECHQLKVLRAKQRLADRASQADLLIQKETSLLTQKYHRTDPRANQHRAGEICFAPKYRTQIGVRGDRGRASQFDHSTDKVKMILLRLKAIVRSGRFDLGTSSDNSTAE